MQGLGAALAAILLAAAGPAAGKTRIDDDGRLALDLGDVAVVHLDEAGRLVLDSVAQIDPAIKAAETPKPAVDHLSFALRPMAGVGTALKVENGYERPFNYRAWIVAGSRRAPTTVCTLHPHIVSFETWQNGLTGAVVGDLAEAPREESVCR